jgi:hypothetical protein
LAEGFYTRSVIFKYVVDDGFDVFLVLSVGARDEVKGVVATYLPDQVEYIHTRRAEHIVPRTLFFQ